MASDVTLDSAQPPRVLLLMESAASGGVASMARLLQANLHRAGWQVQTCHCDAAPTDCLQAARHADVLLASNNFRPTYVAWLLGLLLGKPVVAWVHGPVSEVLEQARAHPFKRLWLRWLYNRRMLWVTVSRSSRESFLRLLDRRLDASVLVVPNAIDTPTPAPTRLTHPIRPATSSAPVRLACIGRLSSEKRPELLLQMLHLLPENFHLSFIGDGPDRDRLETAGRDLLAQGRLLFTGHLPCDPSLYQQFDLTLLASIYEGCPLVVLESLSAGVPCVAVPNAAMLEMYGENAAVLLAAQPSAQALATCVLQVLSVPRERVETAMHKVLRHHRIEDFLQHWQAILLDAARHES